jgi:hypothetical protein
MYYDVCVCARARPTKVVTFVQLSSLVANTMCVCAATTRCLKAYKCMTYEPCVYNVVTHI